MDYAIRKHKLDGVPYNPASGINKKITPRVFVMHDTAGRLTKGNSAAYLRNHNTVSVHLINERDGSIEQQVPFNHRANHAGESSYHGEKYVNNFSVGMEIVNPGKLTFAGNNKARAWFGQLFDIDEYQIVEVTTREHGHGFWMPYTESQIESCIDVARTVCEYYRISDIVPHWYISPGRKVDTNPLFPLEQVKSRALGRDIPDAVNPDVIAAGQPEVMTGDFGVTDTPGDTLNMRRWPSFNPNVITAIPHGTRVPIIKAGEFDGRKWLKVTYGGHEGWVIAHYINEV